MTGKKYFKCRTLPEFLAGFSGHTYYQYTKKILGGFYFIKRIGCTDWYSWEVGEYEKRCPLKVPLLLAHLKS
jgi:hypothetical protein